MKWFEYNDREIFDLTWSRNEIPDFLVNKAKQKLQRKKHVLKREIKLLEDLVMPTASQCVTVTSDNKYLLMAGVYKPTMKCFDLDSMSLKWERGLDALTEQIVPLNTDYSNLVLRQSERRIEFHMKCGKHHCIKLPDISSDMCYSKRLDRLFITGPTSTHIWQYCPVDAQFCDPFVSSDDSAFGYNCVAFCDESSMLLAGGNKNVVRLFDVRSNNEITKNLSFSNNDNVDISDVTFKNSLTVAVSTSQGQILMFDLRQQKPYLVKDQGFFDPVRKVSFCDNLTLSIDRNSLCIWDSNSGDNWCYITMPNNAHCSDMIHLKDSGLIFMSNESGPEIMTYFLPGLGGAPQWCPHLLHFIKDKQQHDDNNVNSNSNLQNYVFLSKGDLEGYGLCHLIGSDYLSAHMHGFQIAKAHLKMFIGHSDEQLKMRGQHSVEKGSEANTVKPSRIKLKLNDGDCEKKRMKISEMELVLNEMEHYAKDRDYIKTILKNQSNEYAINEQNEDFRLLDRELRFKLKKERAKKRKMIEAEAANNILVSTKCD